MTKAEIVNNISKATGIEKATTLAVVEAFMDTVKDSLSKESLFISADSEVLSSNTALRKLHATSQLRLL